MSELLPCPFCGGRQTYRKHDGGVWLTTTNHKRGCIMRDALAFVAFDTEAEAIAAWNTRAERTCKVEGDYWHDHGGDGSDTYEFVLSCGHKVEWLDDDDSPRYCPRCGAKVVGE